MEKNILNYSSTVIGSWDTLYHHNKTKDRLSWQDVDQTGGKQAKMGMGHNTFG